MNRMKDVEGVEKTISWLAKSAWAITPSKIVISKFLNYMFIFIMNPLKDVEGGAETSSWLTKFKSAWAITPSKINESEF